MSLLNNENLTTAEKQQIVRERMVSNMRSLFSFMRSQYSRMYNDTWNNRMGLTPQQVFEAFDTDAQEFFTLGISLYQYLNTIQPGTLDLPAPFELEITPEGRINVLPNSSSSTNESQSSLSSVESSVEEVSSADNPSETSGA